MTNSSSSRNRMIAMVGGGAVLFVLGLIAGVLLSGVPSGQDHGGHLSAAGGGEQDLYTCGMHPNVIQEGPGICPICNMDLTPMKQSSMGMDLVSVYEGDVEASRAIVIDPTVVQNIGVRTAVVERGVLAKTIHATGEIVEDETRVGIVNLKVAGWIDKVHVDETGQKVRQGEPLLEIYSPQLVTTQEEYLIALNNLRRVEDGAPADVVQAASRTLESTRRRLLYWDITSEQIAALERSGEVRKNMVLRSPFSGVVTMKSALPGQKVAPGTDLYHIADLSVVWVRASVFDSDLPFITLGQDATMTLAFLPGETFSGQVTFISPVLDPKTRDLKIRLEFPNASGKLRPGMYADVAVRSILDDNAILLPSEGVIRSGKRNVVFVVRGTGRFTPTGVTLGASGEDNTLQVLDGLAGGEEIVTSAQFLLDSESSFQEAIRKMMAEKQGDTMAGDGAGSSEETATRRVDAVFEGAPIANAIAIEPDGGITIMCPVMKGTRTIAAGDIFSEYQGMRVYYCCPGCQQGFDAEPERFLAELDAVLRDGN